MITCSVVRRRQPPEPMRKEIVQQIRIGRIKQSQEEEIWIVKLKEYPIGDVDRLDNEEAKLCSQIAPDYEVKESEMLFFCPITADSAKESTELLRLVMPDLLQHDFLHHFHLGLEEGIKGWAAFIERSARTFIGSVYTGVSNVMWANVLILGLEKGFQQFEENLQEIYK